MSDSNANVVGLTADIVAAYVDANSVQAGDLPALIQSVYNALSGIDPAAAVAVEEPITKATPAQIRKSVTPDGLVSFIDGRSYKMLKRHIRTNGMTVQDYKAKFGLPADYPLTAPNYSAARSQFAKSKGLGQKVRKDAQPAPVGKTPRKTRAPRA